MAVLGGGPAGSTAAGLLASEGHSVLLIEQDRFPRFHIGESLLPRSLALFDRLGFDAAGLPAVRKAGADFLDERTGEYARYDFADGLSGTPGHAWQVERAAFDQALLERARRLGAEVWQPVRARSVVVGHDHVTVDTTAGRLSARYVVDATGRHRLLARQHGSYERIDGYGRAAIWAHYEGLRKEAAAELLSSGNIVVLLIDGGWGWIIPLVGSRLSVGFVASRRGVVSDEWFARCVEQSPLLRRLTTGARRGLLQSVGDYSYRNRTAAGPRWACIGDARCFLDPVFSSGVALAMESACGLSDLLSPALRGRREADERLLAPLQERLRHAEEVFGALIHRFYHTRLVEHFFFCEDPDPRLRAGLISLLAGDVWRDDNPFQELVTSTRGVRRHARTNNERRDL